MTQQASLTDGLSLAKKLIEARKAKGLSEEDVANELRLSTDIVRAIEADQFSAEKMSVFVKGYIRAYAKLVGLDLAEVDAYFSELGVLDHAKKPAPQQFDYRKRTSKDKPMKWTTVIIIVVLIVLVVIWVQWQRSAGDTAVIQKLPNQASTMTPASAVPTTTAVPQQNTVDNQTQAMPVNKTQNTVASTPVMPVLPVQPAPAKLQTHTKPIKKTESKEKQKPWSKRYRLYAE